MTVSGRRSKGVEQDEGGSSGAGDVGAQVRTVSDVISAHYDRVTGCIDENSLLTKNLLDKQYYVDKFLTLASPQVKTFVEQGRTASVKKFLAIPKLRKDENGLGVYMFLLVPRFLLKNQDDGCERIDEMHVNGVQGGGRDDAEDENGDEDDDDDADDGEDEVEAEAEGEEKDRHLDPTAVYSYIGSAVGIGGYRSGSWGLMRRKKEHLRSIRDGRKSIFYNYVRYLHSTHILFYRPLLILTHEPLNLSDVELFKIRVDVRLYESVLIDALSRWCKLSSRSAKDLHETPIAGADLASWVRSLNTRNPLSESIRDVPSDWRLTRGQWLANLRAKTTRRSEEWRALQADNNYQRNHKDEKIWREKQLANKINNDIQQLRQFEDPEVRAKVNEQVRLNQQNYRKRIAEGPSELREEHEERVQQHRKKARDKETAEVNEVRGRPGNEKLTRRQAEVIMRQERAAVREQAQAQRRKNLEQEVGDRLAINTAIRSMYRAIE